MTQATRESELRALAEAIESVSSAMPITDYEAYELHDRGWSSGHGWENELDWWREQEHSNFSAKKPTRYAYEDDVVRNNLFQHLVSIRRAAARTVFDNAMRKHGLTLLSELDTLREENGKLQSRLSAIIEGIDRYLAYRAAEAEAPNAPDEPIIWLLNARTALKGKEG